MTVKQLREILEKYEDTTEIVFEVVDYCGSIHYIDRCIEVYETLRGQVCIKGIHF